MKYLIFTLLFMLIYCDKSDAQLATFEHDIYMYEFAIKRPGWANLGFLIVKHDKCQEISFDIRFTKDKVDRVNKTETEMDRTDNILKTYYYFYAGSGMKHIPGNPDLP